MKILVTGAAGFVGSHLALRLLNKDYSVVGIDSLNSYYDVRLKYGRLEQMLGLETNALNWNESVPSKKFPNFQFVRCDIASKEDLERVFKEEKIEVVCHLAAQAGVRHSISNPDCYIEANIKGFLNLLECCRHYSVSSLSYASSSSVYGLNRNQPFNENQSVGHPVSIYAATKRSNELMAHAYSHLFNIPTTAMRFFTVYGPWGRPDMALFSFTESILRGKPIDVYNNGDMYRDFTYIDDVVDGVMKVISHPAMPNRSWDPNTPDPSSSVAPFRIYNIGNSSPVSLMDFIRELENQLGKKARINFLEMQPGDIEVTYADVTRLRNDTHYQPSINISEGIASFTAWYQDYYS